MEAAAGNQRTPYTILLSGSTAGPNPFPGGNAAAGMLRYSRILDFSGWRVVTAALGIGPQVRDAAASFMN
jgi:hypothetical protein